MHEVGIIQSTLQLAEQSARASGATRIHRVRMRVGRMTGVVREALEYAFEVVREGTMAAQATLEVETVPVVCWCAHCAGEFAADDWLYVCPTCGGFSAELRRGLELELASLEIS